MKHDRSRGRFVLVEPQKLGSARHRQLNYGRKCGKFKGAALSNRGVQTLFQRACFSPFQNLKGGALVLFVVVAASSILAAVLALALAREVRLRRALERLLSRILAAWRRRHDRSTMDSRDADSHGHSDDWL